MEPEVSDYNFWTNISKISGIRPKYYFFLFFSGDMDLISDLHVNICTYSINTIADWKHVGNLSTKKSKTRAEGENKREEF